jgi:hypothetical protein
MKIYAVSYFNETDWCTEIVGYYTSRELAQQAIDQCDSQYEFTIWEYEVNTPIEVE